MNDVGESSRLLHTPAAVSQRHRLAPPSVRFPQNHLGSNDSYGVADAFKTSTLDENTLVDSHGQRGGSTTSSDQQRRKLTRENSKVYTSFPTPTGTPWRENGTPTGQREYPFFSRFFARSPEDDPRQYSTIDEETANGAHHPGLPKISRACLIAEIKCYGSYIVPVVLVFVVLVLLIALGIYYNVIKN